MYEHTIGLDAFVTEISHSTSLTSTDVRAAILEIIDIFHRYLARGHKVKLDGIGTFKVSFKGDGTDKPEDLASSNIDRSTIKVTFVADASLNQKMKSEISLKCQPASLPGKQDVVLFPRRFLLRFRQAQSPLVGSIQYFAAVIPLKLKAVYSMIVYKEVVKCRILNRI